jgi:hypothetical protein
MCFTIVACGCRPRSALDLSDGSAVRFVEILKLITACDLSIHDLSRVELDQATNLPRFNMPLELGADLGLRLAGPPRQQRRRILILDAELHRYDKTLSDISGMDISSHQNNVDQIIKCARDWLNANRDDLPVLPGAAAIAADYALYQAIAADVIQSLRLDPHDRLPHADFLHVVGVSLPLIEQARNRDRGSRS